MKPWYEYFLSKRRVDELLERLESRRGDVEEFVKEHYGGRREALRDLRRFGVAACVRRVPVEEFFGRRLPDDVRHIYVEVPVPIREDCSEYRFSEGNRIIALLRYNDVVYKFFEYLGSFVEASLEGARRVIADITNERPSENTLVKRFLRPLEYYTLLIEVKDDKIFVHRALRQYLARIPRLSCRDIKRAYYAVIEPQSIMRHVSLGYVYIELLKMGIYATFDELIRVIERCSKLDKGFVVSIHPRYIDGWDRGYTIAVYD